ncbi:MAG: transporter [bacterium]|nr:transporter [bacterium]
MRPLTLGLLLVLLLAAAPPATASGWTQPQGHGFYKMGAQILRGHDFHDGQGRSVQIPTLAQYTLSTYVEYGLRDNLTLITYLPVFERITLNRLEGRPSGFVYTRGEAVNGIGDGELGLRFRLWQGAATVVSAALNLGLALGNDEQASGLQTGDGEWNQRLELQLGHSLYPAPAWIGASLGYDHRLRGYADRFVYNAEIGTHMGQRWHLILHARGVRSLDEGADTVRGGAGGLAANDQRYFSFGPEVLFDVAADVTLSLGTMTGLDLRNTLSAPSLSVGLSTRR